MSTKISALTAVGSLSGTEQVEVNQSGTSKRTTTQAIADLGGGGGAPLLVRAHTSGNVSYTASTDTVIDFNSVDTDTGSDVTTGGSWHYTAPATAIYDIHLSQALVSGFGTVYAAGTLNFVDVYINGSQLVTLSYEMIAVTTTITNYAMNLSGSIAVPLSSGDTLALKFANYSGQTRQLLNNTYIEIYKVT